MIVSVWDGSDASALCDVEDSDTFIIRTTDNIFPGDMETDTTHPIVVTDEDTETLSLTREEDVKGGSERQRDWRTDL
jgi:hypothetical protein